MSSGLSPELEPRRGRLYSGAVPGNRPHLPWNSPVPRAPLPARGVTSFRVMPCITSKGVTLSSTLVRAHVPDRVPLSNFGLGLIRKSSQVAASPCCDTALPDVKLRIFPRMPGSLPRRSASAVPVIFPAFIGLPPVYIGSATRLYPLKRLHSGWVFRGCNHSIMFRPPGLLATPVAPTVEAERFKAVVAFTSEQNTRRYLRVHRIC